MKHSCNFIKNISNPVYKDLIKLKLIKSKNLRVISNNTRNKRIKVIQDTREKIIFLQKYVTNKNYYRQSKNNIIKNKNTVVVINKKKLKLSGLDDNERRYKQFKKLLNNKYVLDYGCGSGNFLKKIKNTKHIHGVEISENHIKHFLKSKQLKIKENIFDFKNKFDVVCLFHVLEHLPNQIKSLKEIKSKMKKKGKIIIEVPHANDILFSIIKNNSFKRFTFWEQHLILHTKKSLKKILTSSGFKNIKIKFFQRYGLDNHLGWIINGKPGGHTRYKNIKNDLNLKYKKKLEEKEFSDTLIATATFD